MLRYSSKETFKPKTFREKSQKMGMFDKSLVQLYVTDVQLKFQDKLTKKLKLNV